MKTNHSLWDLPVKEEGDFDYFVVFVVVVVVAVVSSTVKPRPRDEQGAPDVLPVPDDHKRRTTQDELGCGPRVLVPR